MKCDRAFDVDLLAVVRGEGGDADFLAHYPACVDCAAEVRVWGELDGMLRAGAGPVDAHPDPAALLALTDAPTTLDAAARADLEGHLARCRVCADEVRSLGSFDPASLGLASTVPAAAPAERAPIPTAVRELETGDATPRGFWLGRLVWHPAFAYALVALLAVPLLRGQLPHLSEQTRAVDARRDGPIEPHASEMNARQLASETKAKLERAPEALADAGREARAPAPPPAQPPAAPQAEAPAARVVQPPPGVAVDFAKRWVPPQEKKAGSADAVAPRPVPESAGGAAPRDQAEQADKERDQHSGNLVGGAGVAAAPAARARGKDAAPVLTISSRKPTIVSADAVAPGIVLRIEPPADLAPGPFDVKVQSRAGRHELGARVTDRADAIAIEIPPHWLLPGDYAVTLQPVDGGRPARLGFTVRAPVAER
jgi:hypothetical protein